MARRDVHISDADLALAIDGELDAGQMAGVASHLSHCWQCRARREELEQAIREFIVHRPAGPAIPPPDGAAAKLRAQMRAAREDPPNRISPRLVFVTGCLSVAASIAALLWISTDPAQAGPLPDRNLTPGATRLISREQVCAISPDDDDRVVPGELALHVFREYRIEQPKPRAYEVDFLIAPALGGAEDIRNLWPQPYDSGIWNSRIKDALEDKLRMMVCQGELDLPAAQQEIASNWIAAYKKYFQTDRPIPAHALFVKDRPWE